MQAANEQADVDRQQQPCLGKPGKREQAVTESISVYIKFGTNGPVQG
jgi:hypothetical protein